MAREALRPLGRRGALALSLGAWGWLATDLAFKDWDLYPWARIVVLIVACVTGLYWLVTTQAVRPRLPSLVLERAGPGFGVRFLPPEGTGKRKLKRETQQLVADMHAYIAAAPGWGEGLADHNKMSEAMEEAVSEDEKRGIWTSYTQQMAAKADAERKANSQKFGGQVEYLLDEYERRKLIDHAEKGKLLWELGSTHWMASLAQRFDALSRKL